MRDIQIQVVGNLVQDPELSYTPSGAAVVNLRIAHTPRVQRGDEWVDGETTFLRAQAWRDLAEHAAESLSQGTRVLVFGTLRTERWADRTTGEVREGTRLQIDAIGPELRFATARVQKTTRVASSDADEYHRSVQAVREQLGGAEVHSGGTPS